jgi:hypothetical protein
MKVVETTIEASEKVSDSKNELTPTEKWLFEIQSGNVNLFTLMKMRAGQQAIVELDEFKKFASESEMRYGIDRALNWTFLQGNLPLTARNENDKIVIKKSKEHTKAIVIFT